MMRAPVGTAATHARGPRRPWRCTQRWQSWATSLCILLGQIPGRQGQLHLAHGPRTQCVDALVEVDSCLWALVQGWVGSSVVSEAALRQATLPKRLGGLGLPNNDRIADAAYLPSRSRARDSVQALWVPSSLGTAAMANEEDDVDLHAAGARYNLQVLSGEGGGKNTTMTDAEKD